MEFLDDVDTYLADFQAAVDQTVDDAASDPEALLAGDTDDPWVDVDAQATEMGLTACGGG